MTLDKENGCLTVPTKQLTNVKIGLMALVKNHLSLNRISPKTNLIHLIGDTFLLRILCEPLLLVNYASQLLRPKFNNLKKKMLSNGHLGLGPTASLA